MKVIMVKRDGALRPADGVAAEDFTRLPNDTEVMVEIKRERSLPHLRKYKALVRKIYQNQSKYPTEDLVDTAIRIAVGHCEVIPILDGSGRTGVIPKSISFASMDQDAFNAFFDRVLDVVVTKILPGVRRSDLKRELEEFTR